MIDKNIKLDFYRAIEEMEKPDSAFLSANLEVDDFKLELKYPREQFIADIKRLLSSYEQDKQTDITSFFGFVLDEQDGLCTLKGYPSVTNIQQEDLSNISAKVYNYVKSFCNENEVVVKDNYRLSVCFNAITKAFPEFLTTIGKLQHKTHSYSVDVHTLKVLQGVMQNPKYQTLTNEDKRVLQIAVLMHDITKKEGEIDKSHPACSAKDAAFILNKFDISQEVKNRICLIIRNHDWLERYNKGQTSAQEFAQILKDGNNFLMECILAEADLKAVQRGGAFYEKYSPVLNTGYEEIKNLINKQLTAA